MLGPKSMTSDPEPAQRPYTSRWEERDARRKAAAKVASDASLARAHRAKDSLVQRVEKAKDKLNGVNAAGAIQLIQSVSSQDYDVYLLAEQHGQARRGVLKQFGAPRGSVKRQYLEDIEDDGEGVGDPNETAEDQQV